MATSILRLSKILPNRTILTQFQWSHSILTTYNTHFKEECIPMKLKPICVYSSHIKRKNYTFPQIKSEDIEVQCVRGSGPGGQAVAKTNNKVVIKHLPTGIVVKCHKTRSQEENRKGAMRLLEEALDLQANGDESYVKQLEKGKQTRDSATKSKNKKRLALKRAFKTREGLD